MVFCPGDVVLFDRGNGLERGTIGSKVSGEFLIDDILSVCVYEGKPRGKNPRYNRKASDVVLVHRPVLDVSWKKETS